MNHNSRNNIPAIEKKDVSKFDGISNIAVNVSTIVHSHSVFSQQNRRNANIAQDKVHYMNYFLIKQLLTDMSRKIMSRHHLGFGSKMQARFKKQVLICRFLGLLPYVK